jgi:ADP-ribose pyrophosphatase
MSSDTDRDPDDHSRPRARRRAVRLETRPIYQGRVLELWVDRVRLPHGREASMELVHHRGAAAVLPLLPDGRVVMISQYRYATGGMLLEIPAGGLEPDEEPVRCARRELAEEAGYDLGPGGELVSLGWIWTTPGFSDERIWLFLARGIVPGRQRLEADEVIEVVTLPWREAVEKARRGQIHDGKTVCALLRAEPLLGGGCDQ